MRVLPSSPRIRRRLAWTLVPLLALGGAAAAFALAPGRHVDRSADMPTGTERAVLPERRVALRPVDRSAIDAVLDRFVPAAVARRDPALAYALATPGLRASAPRSDWLRGRLPVFPLQLKPQGYHGWTLNEATPSGVSLDLLVGAQGPGDVRGVAFTVHLQRLAGAWRVDGMAPAAIFHDDHTITSERDFGPGLVSDRGGLSTTVWVVVPAVLLGLGFAFPLAFFGLRFLRDRRATARYGREHGSGLPPLPRRY